MKVNLLKLNFMDGVTRGVRHYFFIRLNNQQAWHPIRYRSTEHFSDFGDVLLLQIQIPNLMSCQTLIIIPQKYILVLPMPFSQLLVLRILLDLVELIILD